MKPALLLPFLLFPAFALAQTPPEVRLSMLKDTFLSGEPLAFMLTARNTADREVLVYHFDHQIGTFDITVEDTANERKNTFERGHDQLMSFSAGYMRLQPGQSLEASFYLYPQPPFDTPGAYNFRVKKTVLLAQSPIPERDMQYLRQHLVELEARFTVAPPDEKRLGALIAQWGGDMLAGNQLSVALLAGVHDERVIPWYDSLLHQPGRADDYPAAIEAIGKFSSSAAAFEILKNELARQEGGNRWKLIRTLAGFRDFPVAPLLLPLKNDDNYAIRHAVLYALEEVNPTVARDVAEALQHDTAEWVRREALGFLEKVRLPAMPCGTAGVHTWIELNRDTAASLDSIVVTFVLHNCSEREIYYDRYGGSPFSFNDHGPFDVEIRSENTGKVCPPKMDIYAGCGISGSGPILPGNLYKVEVPLGKYAVIDGPGVYRAAIAQNVVWRTAAEMNNTSGSRPARSVPVRYDLPFVIKRE